MDFGRQSIELREAGGGQIGTLLKQQLNTKEDLSVLYTPGIAAPSLAIAGDRSLARKLTIKRNSVAVVSDGSAVLGLGNVGPEAALPVMEGKAMLFKRFADIDAYPIVLATQSIDEIVQTVVNIAPGFGGINLEDISAPRCFEIERRLGELLDIPVFHDDQHGTAICTLGALANALKITGRSKEDIRVVLSGAGAAGIAIARLLRDWGVRDFILTDSKGICSVDRTDLNPYKMEFAVEKGGTLNDALENADVFIGVSQPDLLGRDDIRRMKADPIVFAMSNPVPEISPEQCAAAGVAVYASGRSDYPNQINNVLVFPGFFRGLFDAGAFRITGEMKIRAGLALAAMVENPTPERVIPGPFEPGVADAVAQAVKSVVTAGV